MQKENALQIVKDSLNYHPDVDKFYVTSDGNVHTDAIAAVGHAQQLSSGNPQVETVTREEADKFDGSAQQLNPNEQLPNGAAELPKTGNQNSESITATTTKGGDDAIAAVGHAQQLSSGNPQVETVTREEADKFDGSAQQLNPNEQLPNGAAELPKTGNQNSESITATTTKGGDEIAIAEAQKKDDESLQASFAQMYGK